MTRLHMPTINGRRIFAALARIPVRRVSAVITMVGGIATTSAGAFVGGGLWVGLSVLGGQLLALSMILGSE